MDFAFLPLSTKRNAFFFFKFELAKQNLAIFSSSSSVFSAFSLGFTILGEIFAYVTVFLFAGFFFFFFNPTIEVVTFRLCGWCMLGVVLLPAFTRLGHECQDLLSLCDGMYVCTD